MCERICLLDAGTSTLGAVSKQYAALQETRRALELQIVQQECSFLHTHGKYMYLWSGTHA